MNLTEIKHEAADAIERSGMQKQAIASSLNTTTSNVSNWLSQDRNFPLDALSRLSHLLNDYRFSCMAAEFVFGIELLPDDQSMDVPQNRYFSSIKEENERKALEKAAFFSIMAKDPTDWATEEIEYMRKYSKELEEETKAEASYSSSVKQSLKIATRGREVTPWAK